MSPKTLSHFLFPRLEVQMSEIRSVFEFELYLSDKKYYLDEQNLEESQTIVYFL